MRKTNDIETALYNLLTADHYSASAHAIPTTLGTVLPHVHVTRTGGYETDLVLEGHYVDFDVYASDLATAMEEAGDLCGWVRELVGTQANAPCYVSRILTLPYNNPDPRHFDLGRVTFKAEIMTRTV